MKVIVLPRPSNGKCQECGYVGWRFWYGSRKVCRACRRALQSPPVLTGGLPAGVSSDQ
jgi:hypothetical protein